MFTNYQLKSLFAGIDNIFCALVRCRIARCGRARTRVAPQGKMRIWCGRIPVPQIPVPDKGGPRSVAAAKPMGSDPSCTREGRAPSRPWNQWGLVPHGIRAAAESPKNGVPPPPAVAARCGVRPHRGSASLRQKRQECLFPDDEPSSISFLGDVMTDYPFTTSPTSPNAGRPSRACASGRSRPCTARAPPQPSRSTAGSPAAPRRAPPATTGTSRTSVPTLCILLHSLIIPC